MPSKTLKLTIETGTRDTKDPQFVMWFAFLRKDHRFSFITKLDPGVQGELLIRMSSPDIDWELLFYRKNCLYCAATQGLKHDTQAIGLKGAYMFPSVGEHRGQRWFANILMLHPSASSILLGAWDEKSLPEVTAVVPLLSWEHCRGWCFLKYLSSCFSSRTCCRDRWRYSWVGWHCGITSYGCICEFHRSYRETKKRYQSADRPEASQYLIQLLDI